MSKPIVLVTGATGYVGAHVVERCIEKGYLVRSTSTVRSTKGDNKLRVNTPGVEVFEILDITTDDLTESLEGVSVVIHIAESLPGKADSDGVLNVVRQAEKAGISKIVVSSTYGIISPAHINHMSIFTDSHLGMTMHDEVDNKSADPFHVHQAGANDPAERALWAYVAKHPGVDVTFIKPGFVYGPYSNFLPGPSSPDELGPNAFFWKLLNGTFPPVGMPPPWVVDVRDIAKAHVAAVNLPRYSPANTKRFVVNGSKFEWNEVLEAMRKALPEITTLPDASAFTPLPGPPAQLDSPNTKKELGIDEFIPPSQTFIDTLKDLTRLRSEWAAVEN